MSDALAKASAAAHLPRRGQSEISDADYDALVRRNNAIQKPSRTDPCRQPEPARQRGGRASPLTKITHAQRMMSLDTFAEDVAEFVTRVRRFLNLAEDAEVALTAEDKIDRLSCRCA